MYQALPILQVTSTTDWTVHKATSNSMTLPQQYIYSMTLLSEMTRAMQCQGSMSNHILITLVSFPGNGRNSAGRRLCHCILVTHKELSLAVVGLLLAPVKPICRQATFPSVKPNES